MGLNLLEKTELWINHITLNQVNLTDLSHVVAGVLGLKPENVLVVDVRPDHITLDILEMDIPPENLIGKETLLLEVLSEMEGVTLRPESFIHSNGILGLICLDGEDPQTMVSRIDEMTDEITQKIAKRAIVFPTGFEVKQGLIEDTNTPFLKAKLEAAGYTVAVGPIMEDDINDMCAKLEDALSRAYGLIITTGGVGAEDKDKTVESMVKIAPDTATPYIVKFKQGTGRHVKDGVKAAVGRVGPSMMVALPGPNDEVQIGIESVLHSIEAGKQTGEIAADLARVLAEKWVKKTGHHHGSHSHESHSHGSHSHEGHHHEPHGV